MASDETPQNTRLQPESPGLSGDMPSPRSRRGLRTFSALQNNRDFRYLFAGNLFGNGAQWLQLITIGWLALDVSGSPFHSIMAVAVRALPTLLIGPWGGVLADRWDRRLLAMVTQIALALWALTFAVLVALDQVDTIWHVYGYTLATGVAFAITQPTRQALIANTVRRPDMANALALSAMSTTSMRMVGAITAGVLLGFLDFQWNFFVECGLYVGMVLLMIPMRTPFRETSTAAGKSGAIGAKLTHSASSFFVKGPILSASMLWSTFSGTSPPASRRKPSPVITPVSSSRRSVSEAAALAPMAVSR